MASKRKKIYEAYLLSAHWKALRQQAFERDNHQCTKCGNRLRLRGHHVKYRGDLRKCTVDDILTLCEDCHTKLHLQQKKHRKQKRRDKKRLRAFYEGRASWWRLVHNVPDFAFRIPFYNREDALQCPFFIMEQFDIGIPSASATAD